MPGNLEATSRPAPQKVSAVRPLVFLLLLVAIIVIVRAFHLEHYLDKERLRQFVAGFGIWGPVIYLSIWTFGPPLSFPGLPITLAGGILFGPFWGVIYTAFGASAGAALAFLVSRYMARDWVAAKLAGTKLRTLDDKVAQHGWKIVAFTRLIPIFPYFLLNFAFGLTRISLFSFTLATLICMLPWTIVFVLFSSEILDLIQGKVSWKMIISIILVIIVSLIPVIYKKLKAKPAEPLEF